MKDKKHKGSADSVGVCSEPAVSVAVTPSHNGISVIHDEIDDLNWERFVGYGPFSDEEAIERIDKFEQRLKDGQVNWTPSEEFDRQLFEEFPWLR